MTAPAAPTVRIPAGPVTPHGAYYFLEGIHPELKLRAFDGSTQIRMMGGRALADPYASPEAVIVSGPIKGLIAPWKMLDQQGANEDGVTFLGAVNEPIEVEIPVRCVARDGKHLRWVVNTLIGSIDKKRTSELSWFTQDMGFWSAKVRWFKTPPGGFNIGGQQTSIEFPLILRADSGFWQGLDDVAEFSLAYEQMVDDFGTDYTVRKDLGDDWSLWYDGPGGGFLYAGKGQARWQDDPKRFLFTEGRTVVATRRDFETDTDNQVNEITFGSFQELGGYNDIWLRQGKNPDGSWNGFGVRARVGSFIVELDSFNNYHKTHLWTSILLLPALPGEKWRGEAGAGDDLRKFRVTRGGGAEALSFRDKDAITPLGAAFRGLGFGSYASGSLITQATPASITRITGGDSTATTRSGFIERINIGDQDRRDRYTLIGPGTFNIGDGPNSTNMITFGPLLPNQKVQLRTDNRRRLIVDLTSTPATAEELVEYRKALADLESFAPIGNIAATLEANASVFGVVPPQGNLHRLLDGRFSRPIPAKSPGRPAEICHVAVSITGGNSDSRILASGTPLRRYPN